MSLLPPIHKTVSHTFIDHKTLTKIAREYNRKYNDTVKTDGRRMKSIWKELNHYKTFKTILPSKEKDYSKISDLQKDKIRRNLESSKSKMQKRVDEWYNDLENETDKHQQKLIENKINKAELTFKD